MKQKKEKARSWTVSFDHVAIATSDLPTLKRVLELLGLANHGTEAVPSQGVRTHFLAGQAATTNIELLEVLDPEGTVAKFIEKRGPGFHHMSFRVTGLDELCTMLRAEGVRLTYDAPRPGAHGTRVNFIHPESTGGVLIEISEKAS